MILQRLCEYGERIEDYPPVHFSYKELDWIIEIGEDEQVDFLPLSEVSRKFLFAENVVNRAGRKVLPRLLGDKAGYVLGEVDKNLPAEFEKDFSRDKFAAFYELIRECYQATGVELVKKVLLLEEAREELEIPEDLNSGDWIGIRVMDRYLLENAAVQKFWQKKQNEVAKERSDLSISCLICEEEKTIADRHPEKLQLQFLGGQGSGNTLISANKNAFESYGLTESFIAPVCFDCGIKYGRAANYLLQNDKTESNRVRAGGAVYIFWRQEAERESLGIGTIFAEAEEDQVKKFINSYRSGSGGSVAEEDNILAEEFYILALSTNDARAVVRDWIVTTPENVKKNLVSYFDSMLIGPKNRYYGLSNLAEATAFDRNKIKPVVIDSLVSYALKGKPLDNAILANIIGRNRAEAGGVRYGYWKAVSHERAALLKMFFNSQPGGEFEVRETLDKTNQDAAYLCGRLFAVVERVQTQAMPGIKSTVVDKYYGTASTAPASVYGNLLRKAQHHLAKLRKDESKRGAYFGLQQEMEEIMGELDDFPAYLSLQEQGKFALGYYQQRGYRPGKSGSEESIKEAEEGEEEAKVEEEEN